MAQHIASCSSATWLMPTESESASWSACDAMLGGSSTTARLKCVTHDRATEPYEHLRPLQTRAALKVNGRLVSMLLRVM